MYEEFCFVLRGDSRCDVDKRLFCVWTCSGLEAAVGGRGVLAHAVCGAAAHHHAAVETHRQQSEVASLPLCHQRQAAFGLYRCTIL